MGKGSGVLVAVAVGVGVLGKGEVACIVGVFVAVGGRVGLAVTVGTSVAVSVGSGVKVGGSSVGVSVIWVRADTAVSVTVVVCVSVGIRPLVGEPDPPKIAPMINTMITKRNNEAKHPLPLFLLRRLLYSKSLISAENNVQKDVSQ